MSRYQLFPNLTADEMAALTADIGDRGVMVPVEFDEDGNILDGHHRAMIADSLGIEYPKVVRTGWTEDQKLVHVVALNAHRRQLKADERADIVARLRKERMSVRAIAKAVGVPKSTVHDDIAVVRNRTPDELPATTTGSDGHTYQATRPAPIRPRLEDTPYEYGDRKAEPAEPPVRDYIELMPPAEREWELAFRRQTRWSKRVGVASHALLSVTPSEFVPYLGADERTSTERTIELIEGWIRLTRQAFAESGALRVVGGKK